MVKLLSIVHLILGYFLYKNFKKFNEHFSSLKAARMYATKITKDYIKFNNSIIFLDVLVSGLNI